MTLNADGLAALTDIYDAAVAPGRWRRALDGVARSVDARAVALLIRRPDPAARDLQMLSSAYLKFSRSPSGLWYIARHARLQNPDWDYLSRQRAHRIVADTETGQNADELDARGDYAMLRKRLGLGRRVGVRLNSDRVWYDAISVAFGHENETVPRVAFDALTPLLPHITKAAEIGRLFAKLRARYAAVLSALDHVQVGLAIALENGEIVVLNDAAQDLIDCSDGVSLGRDGRLTCQDSDQAAALSAYIRQATGTARGENDTAERLMTVDRRSGASPLLVDIVPLRDSGAELASDLDGALLTLVDPDSVPSLRMDRFEALYELTAAEADVCRLILQGCSVEEISERRGTSPTTAKNQVSAVLAKTGVRRRTELIRLVLRVLPPVA